ncbi:MAG: ammonia-forming cytochrome c nitrite reductase subunit c552 [bacterium]
MSGVGACGPPGSPGARRPETLAKTGLADLDEASSCAACHAAKRIYAEGFDPGDSFSTGSSPMWQVRERYYVDGRSSTLNYRYVDYMQNGCFRRTTRTMDCGFCHPPHGLESTADRTVQAGNALCTQCHLEHKTALVAHTHHRPESEGSRCVACHMPPMDLDLRMTVRDHTINSPLPELTRQYGVPNACAHCHADQPVAWAEAAVERWFGGRPTSRAIARACATAPRCCPRSSGGARCRWIASSPGSTTPSGPSSSGPARGTSWAAPGATAGPSRRCCATARTPTRWCGSTSSMA